MWICNICGQKHGKMSVGVSTFHMDICNWCRRLTLVTEDRDFGYPDLVVEPDMEDVVIYDTPTMTEDSKQKTIYDVWMEARELLPGRHVAVKELAYLENGMIKARLVVK